MNRSPSHAALAAFLVGAAAACTQPPARAQNDWQYPDPYFGILEVEKSHDGTTVRRPRAEVHGAPRPPRLLPTAPPVAPGTAVQPAPATKSRWRNRWRREPADRSSRP